MKFLGNKARTLEMNHYLSFIKDIDCLPHGFGIRDVSGNARKLYTNHHSDFVKDLEKTHGFCIRLVVGNDHSS